MLLLPPGWADGEFAYPLGPGWWEEQSEGTRI